MVSILPEGIPSEDQTEALVVKESAPTPEVIKANAFRVIPNRKEVTVMMWLSS